MTAIYHELKDIAPKEIWPGILARLVEGELSTLAIVELDPGIPVPQHHHPNEQLGFVIEGSIRFTVDGETRELGPGGNWRILSETPHEAVAGESGAVVAEVYAPLRADWKALPDQPARPTRWPK